MHVAGVGERRWGGRGWGGSPLFLPTHQDYDVPICLFFLYLLFFFLPSAWIAFPIRKMLFCLK